MPRLSLAERFWLKVNKTETCWNWIGAMTSKGPRGRGQIRVGGRMRLATHVAWELCVGPVPLGLKMLHRCANNPRCVRPDHLYPGTDAQNMADSIRAGRVHWRDGLPMARTECRLGHPLDRVDRLGRKYCRTCNTIAVRLLRERRRAS